MLEDHADLALDCALDAALLFVCAGGDVEFALDVDLACIDRVQPHDASEQRAFAAAARSDDEQPILPPHLEIEALEDLDGTLSRNSCGGR